MILFESVYKEVEDYFINKLPKYIDKINKSHNDGIIIRPFENLKLFDKVLNQPSFKCKLEMAESTTKDRLIDVSNFYFTFEINIFPTGHDPQILFWRYAEAVTLMFCDEETDYFFELSKAKDNMLYVRVSNEYD